MRMLLILYLFSLGGCMEGLDCNSDDFVIHEVEIIEESSSFSPKKLKIKILKSNEAEYEALVDYTYGKERIFHNLTLTSSDIKLIKSKIFEFGLFDLKDEPISIFDSGCYRKLNMRYSCKNESRTKTIATSGFYLMDNYKQVSYNSSYKDAANYTYYEKNRFFHFMINFLMGKTRSIKKLYLDEVTR